MNLNLNKKSVVIRCFESKYKSINTNRARKFMKIDTMETLQVEISLEKSLVVKLVVIKDDHQRSPVNLYVPPPYTDNKMGLYNWIYTYIMTMSNKNNISTEQNMNARTAMVAAVVGTNLMTSSGSSIILHDNGDSINVNEIILCGRFVNIPTGKNDEYYSCETPRMSDLKTTTWSPFNMKFKKDTYSFTSSHKL
jgi:hypothetical protein